MQLFRNAQGGYAVMILECDQPIPTDIEQWLSHIDGIQKITIFNQEACQLQTGGVGVCIAHLHGGEGERQSFLFGEGIAVWNAQVIRLHTEQTGNECAVGAVSVPRECKTAVQRNICVYGSFTEQLAGSQSDAHGAGGVTAGRPYHNGSQNIKQTHENPP